MSSNPHTRLQAATEAWSRLFNNARAPTPGTINTENHSRNNHPPPNHTTQNTTHSRIDSTNELNLIYSNRALKENRPWGDVIEGNKEIGITRIYCQNVNGIKLETDGGQYKELCQIQQEVQADIACYQEINLDTTQYQVNQTVQTTTRQFWHRARVNLASSTITFQNQWKPGGTAIISTGSITGRVIATGHDELGRWSYQTFQGGNRRQLTVISAYQVVAKYIQSKGQFSAGAQQQSLLIRHGDNVRDPRQAFRRDLKKFLHQLLSKQNNDIQSDVLLVGDFNEQIGDEQQGMSSIATEFDLTDIFKIQHPHLLDPATYARGRKRLDYALGTPGVARAVHSCGYEPFNFRFCTDHRAYFLDFQTDTLFGSPTQTLVHHSTRILQSNNVKQVTRYINTKHQLLSNCNAFNRGNQLSKAGIRHEFAERLDSDVLRNSLAAEHQLQRYREHPWSLELAQARRKVAFLSKVLSMLRTGIDHHDILRRANERYNDSWETPTTAHECSKALRQAKQHVTEIVQRSFQTRDSERDRQIAHLEAEIAANPNRDKKKKATILRNLKKAEAIKRMFQKLQMLRQTRQRGGITRIEVPQNPHDDPRKCTHWKIIDVPTEILIQLQKRNRQHFGQAHGTPFTVPPLSTDLGFTSMTPSGTMILDGRYDAANLDSAVQQIIQQLQVIERATTHKLQPSISHNDFVGKLQSWRESTSTSPSGLHLGHYKSLLARHEFSDLPSTDPRRLEMDAKQTDLLTLQLQLINYALETGYSYQRWQQVANAMLFKEPGNIKIHRTRVIHLYEADYNLAMGLKWKEAMTTSEATNLINNGQYGSRPSRGAHDPVFIEEFQLEISRSSRKALIQTNYDATSCYDRIIPNLAALVSQRFGVPQPTVQTNMVTLQHAKYRLRTELGLSEHHYTHEDASPIYGTGQGSGNSPMIWCFLSSILFDCYEKRAHGAVYDTPDKRHRTKLYMVGYVDDSNGQTNSFTADNQPPTSELLQKAQHDAQQWHDLLHASGGALELSKCVYQLITWQFLSKGQPLLEAGVPNHSVQVNTQLPNGQCTTQAIQGLSAYSAHKTLGHFKDPNGAQIRQQRVLQEKCTNAATFIARSPLNREEAWTYYFSIYLPSVGFPLAPSHFTKKTLDRVQRQAMSAIIAKCGYNRKTKREIIYGPAHLGGANFRSLYSVQGVGQVTAFLKYWRTPHHQAGKLLRIAVAWTQYAIGTSTPFLTDTATPLPHMESRWLKSLREYLRKIRGSIELDQSYVPQIERVHDFFIMDAILASKRFKASEISQLNYCRMYLQVVTVSDITCPGGRDLDPDMLSGMPGRHSSTTKWHHFNQARPSEQQWELWQRANHIWGDAKGRLREPLGKWLHPTHHQRRTWPVYGDKHGRIYTTWRKPDGRTAIRQHQLIRPNNVGAGEYPLRYSNQDHNKRKLPGNCIPLDIRRGCDDAVQRFIYDHHRIKLQSPPRQHSRKITRNHDFSTAIHNLEAWETDLLQHVTMVHDAFTTYQLMQHRFHAASDGSVRHGNQGAFGWIISTASGERIVYGQGPARGYRLTSYRAEGYGILSILRFLIQLQQYCQATPTWRWRLSSDNIALVNKIIGGGDDEMDRDTTPDRAHDWATWQNQNEDDIEDPTDNWGATADSFQTNVTLEADWDVLNEIRWAMDQGGLEGGTIFHILGHQDRHKAYDELPLQAQLNVDADRLASQYQDRFGEARPSVLLFPHAAAQVHIATYGTCTTRLPQTLRRAEAEQHLLAHIQDRNGWSAEVMQTINWDAHEMAIKKSNQRRIHITKLVHDILPTNKVVHRNHVERQTCPICPERRIEDRDHIIRCQHPTRAQWRADTMTTLEKKCKDMKTNPGLTKVLLNGLDTWFQGGHQLEGDQFSPKFHRLIRQQNQIGWRQLFSGRLSREWAGLQDDYIFLSRARQRDQPNSTSLVSRRYTGDTWCTAIITEIWAQWLQVWTLRNADIHGHDQRTRAIQREKVLNARLQAIYQQRFQMEPRVQDLLYDTIEEHSRQSSNSIQNWLAVHEATITASIRHAKRRAIHGMQSIRSYFAPTGRPPEHHHNNSPASGQQPGANRSGTSSSATQ